MARGALRLMGGLLLGFTPFFVVGALVTGIRYVSPGDRVTAFLGWGIMAASFIAVGVGLLCLRKWAALAFSLLTAACAVLFITQAVRGMTHPISGRADWLGFPFGFLLLIPSVITLKAWHSLSWRRNQA